METIYLISYDISEDKIRTKIAKQLQYYGLERVQYSVFVGSMRATLFPTAQQWLQQHLPPTDKLLIVPLPPQIVSKVIEYGEFSVDWLLVTGQRHTLYVH